MDSGVGYLNALSQCSGSLGMRSNAHLCQIVITKITEIISFMGDAFSGFLCSRRFFATSVSSQQIHGCAAGVLCLPFVVIVSYDLEQSALCKSYIDQLMLRVAHLFG